MPPKNAAPIHKSPTRAPDVRFFQSDRHRKIAQYISLSGDVWDSIGHGTHTSGSIAGKPVDGSARNAAKYQGVAPDARLAFFDLGRASSDVVMIPYSLDGSYFPYAYQAVRYDCLVARFLLWRISVCLSLWSHFGWPLLVAYPWSVADFAHLISCLYHFDPLFNVDRHVVPCPSFPSWCRPGGQGTQQQLGCQHAGVRLLSSRRRPLCLEQQGTVAISVVAVSVVAASVVAASVVTVFHLAHLAGLSARLCSWQLWGPGQTVRGRHRGHHCHCTGHLQKLHICGGNSHLPGRGPAHPL